MPPEKIHHNLTQNKNQNTKTTKKDIQRKIKEKKPQHCESKKHPNHL
jgi:hypothetical protein